MTYRETIKTLVTTLIGEMVFADYNKHTYLSLLFTHALQAVSKEGLSSLAARERLFATIGDHLINLPVRVTVSERRASRNILLCMRAYPEEPWNVWSYTEQVKALEVYKGDLDDLVAEVKLMSPEEREFISNQGYLKALYHKSQVAKGVGLEDLTSRNRSVRQVSQAAGINVLYVENQTLSTTEVTAIEIGTRRILFDDEVSYRAFDSFFCEMPPP